MPKPPGCPTGTVPVDEDARLTRDGIHKIKAGIFAGPADWVGIDIDGNIWSAEGGVAADQGHYTDYI